MDKVWAIREKKPVAMWSNYLAYNDRASGFRGLSPNLSKYLND